MIATTPSDVGLREDGITMRSIGELCVIGIEGKDAAVSLRRRLVRQGFCCSFPMPTWEVARHEFHVKCSRGLSRIDLEQRIDEWSREDRQDQMQRESLLQTAT